MDPSEYKQQLLQIDSLLNECSEGPERDELLSLKANIEELLALTEDTTQNEPNDDDEYALFMAEMTKEGAVQGRKQEDIEQLKLAMEGKKYRAPHTHNWGQTVYHNVMVSSILPDNQEKSELEVRVLFLNPTHQEMLPCPYFFDSEGDCKFSEEKCRFSHGETVPLSALQDYIEPEFEKLTIGSKVLARQSNNLWSRARIKNIFNDKCSVQFESNKKHVEVEFEHIFPLTSDADISDSDTGNSDVDDNDLNSAIPENDNEDVINMSLINGSLSQSLGEWEKYTKGMGSRLMQKMGYIVGSGLGKDSAGRVEPVTAVILPAGKSLDHCMKLKEKYGGDENFFSAEKKLKRMQKRQEKISQKAYERESNKTDVFTFINSAIHGEHSKGNKNQNSKSKFRESLRNETEKDLNVAGLVIYENIKKLESDIEKYREILSRQTDKSSPAAKNILEKLKIKQSELGILENRALSIKNEQQFRSDHKKLTIF